MLLKLSKLRFRRGESIKGKKRDSSGSRKKKQEDDDSEFGFHHAHSPSSLSSSSHSSRPENVQDKPTISANKSMNNNKYDPEMLEKNGKLLSSEPKTSQSPKRQNHRGMSPDEVVPPPQIARDPYQEQGAPVHSQQRPPPKKEIPRNSQNHQAPQTTQNRPSARTAYDKPHMQMRQAPSHNQKNVRKENGESAYFSDTSGATDSSRFANSSDRSNTQHPSQNQAQTAVKRQDSIAKLGNWVMNQRMRQQSNSTLNSPQRTNVPSNFDTASEFSSVSQQQPRKSATLSARGPQRLGPPSTRRYRARTYNEYMDPMEVASSTISMPPIQHMGGNRLFATHTLPRPQSIEHVDGSGRHNRPANNTMDPRRMVSSKSAGNIIAVDQYGVPTSPKQGTHHQDPNHIKRAKSDYVFQNGNDLEQQYLANFAKAQKQNQVVYRAPRQQKYPRPGSASKNSSEPRSAGSASNSSSGGLTPRRSVPKSGGTPKYNDVFSPRSDISSTRGSRKHGQMFHFEDPPSQKGNRKQGQYEGGRGPGGQRNALSPTSPGKSDNSSVEVKQIQKGQLRAFVLSAKTPKTQLPPPQRQTPLKSSDQPVIRVHHPSENENDIEAKLKRLNELDRTLLQISDNMASLQSDKERLEDELSAARSKLHSRYSTGSRESNNQLRDQRQLEEQLSNVKGQLSIVAQKLQDMSEENEEFETEIKKLKTKLIEDLRTQRVMTDDVYNSISDKEKESKRKLEWELGRVEFMMEGLNKQKIGLVNKLNVLNESNADDSPLLSPLSPLSQVSPTSRSPRDVKRTSMERRTSNNRPSNSSASSGSTPNGTPVKKYFTLPGRGISHATSVESITAESLAKTSPRPTSARSVSSIGSTNSNLHRTKSAAERLFQSNYTNHAPEQEAREMKRLQKEIIRNRRNNLKSSSMGDTIPRRHSNPTGMTLPTRSHMKVGIDVQMALKHHRMPKVLQRAKRDMARAEAERLNKEQSPVGFDIDDLDRQVKQQNSGLYEKDNYDYNNGSVDAVGHKEVDLEPEEIHLDVNLTHQLIAPDKVEIPERYVEYENIELSPAEEKMKHRKVVAIEKMLAKSGQQASLPAVHLAAALAVEAGSVARAVAMHAQEGTHRTPGDGQKDGEERPVTDGSSSAGEDQEPVSPSLPEAEFSAACIV